jgi:hypothetical protein
MQREGRLVFSLRRHVPEECTRRTTKTDYNLQKRAHILQEYAHHPKGSTSSVERQACFRTGKQSAIGFLHDFINLVLIFIISFVGFIIIS